MARQTKTVPFGHHSENTLDLLHSHKPDRGSELLSSNANAGSSDKLVVRRRRESGVTCSHPLVSSDSLEAAHESLWKTDSARASELEALAS